MTREKSDLVDRKRINTYKSILQNSGVYKTRFIEVYVRGSLAAIDLVITFADTYYMVKGGNDVMRFPGIGNYMLYIELEDALKNGYSKVNALQEDYGWKHRIFEPQKVFIWEKK